MKGYAQGSTYTITYIAPVSGMQASVDSLLQIIDESLSTYKKASLINRFNESDSGVYIDELFSEVFLASQRIYRHTKGFFDPSVAPLVYRWGFGPQKNASLPDSTEVAQLLTYTGLGKFVLQENNFLSKPFPQSMLDFNAIAQGYSVDLIARLLESRGIENYMIELGGEIRTNGLNAKNEKWKIGIDAPIENAAKNKLQTVLELSGEALATSGNYRKFTLHEGRKVVHTLNPHTGFPAINQLLSATVIMSSCMDADAYATAIMAMGLENAKAFLSEYTDIKVLLIFSNEKNELEEFRNF